MGTSKGVNNAQAIVGMVMLILPWILRIFGVDVPDIQDTGTNSSELFLTGTGGVLLANAEPVRLKSLLPAKKSRKA